MSNFTVSIAAARVNAGMNQQEFADEIGVSKSTIFNWEQGVSEPTASQLRKVSEVSGIPMDYIFIPSQS